MLTIKARKIGGNKGLIDMNDLYLLVECAKKIEKINLSIIEDELPIEGIMKLQEQSGAFDFLDDPREDIYTVNDLKVRYK